MTDSVLLKTRSLRFGWDQRLDFLGPVDLEVHAGDCWAVIGPNGAGKSTLLRILAGILTPAGGEVLIKNRPQRDYSTSRLAREVAFLPQVTPTLHQFTAAQVVLMGTFPRQGLLPVESPDDVETAYAALRRTDTLPYAERDVDTLSGGERQRVHLAAVLAQGTDLLLLDEPTSALDLSHQLKIGDILKDCAAHGAGIVVVTHDINLAARLCTHVLLLDDGRVTACGSPQDVLTPEHLEPVYHVTLATGQLPGEDVPWVLPVGWKSPTKRW